MMHESQIQWMISFQEFLGKTSSWIWFFRGVTTLGEEISFLVLIPFIWLVWNRAIAARLATLIFIGIYTSSVFKNWFQQPRPFELSQKLSRLVEAGGFGLPSGHSVTSIVCFGYLSTLVKRKELKWGLWMIVFMIGLSRVFLGVHFPTDVLGGWLLGGIVLADFIAFHSSVESFAHRTTTQTLFFGIGIVCCLLAVLYPYPTPVATMGAMAGVWISMLISIRFRISYPIPDRMLFKAAMGIMGVLLVGVFSVCLTYIFPKATEQLYLPIRFLKYFLVTLWLGIGVPRILHLLFFEWSRGSREAT